MGLRDNKKRKNIFQWLLTQNFEVIFLQETHIYQQKDIETINNEWQSRHYWAYSSYHSVGVGVLFSPNFPGTIEESQIRSDYEGRILYVPIKLEDSNIQLLNVYASNIAKERKNFFDSLPEYIKGHTPLCWGVTGTVLRTFYWINLEVIECQTLRPSPPFGNCCEGRKQSISTGSFTPMIDQWLGSTLVKRLGVD